MKIVARNFKISSAVYDYVAKKIGRLETHFGAKDISVTLTVEKNVSVAQALARTKKTKSMIKVKESGEDIYSAVDKLYAVLKEKIGRVKSRRIRKTSSRQPVPFPRGEEFHRIQVLTISRKEAMAKLDKTGFRFYLYIDKETGIFSVIYKKEDGVVGIIHPVFE
ncbi:MAG: ribosome-associated translation inhibitor RaiA [Elusimicrobia bacterium]|nr:ribosome-associated translation inhibitor RaiA [Elusimicrobiota bacterium]